MCLDHTDQQYQYLWAAAGYITIRASLWPQLQSYRPPSGKDPDAKLSSFRGESRVYS